MKSNEVILDLINKNATANEICDITGLSHKQLFYRMNMLKIKGYNFKNKYYYNGDIVYKLNRSLVEANENEASIITSKKDKKIKAVFISDLHFGNKNERPDLLFETYNFCAKEGINIIINAGDLIDGPIGCGDVNQKNITSVEKQIEHLLLKYPFDKNILNFISLGNHDYFCLKDSGLDIQRILNNKRHDLIPLGYGYGVIYIKNDKIIVKHPTELGNEKLNNVSHDLVLTGHSHQYKNESTKSYLHVWIPSLSELPYSDIKGTYKQLPSIILANIEFNDTGLIKTCILEHHIFVNNNIYKISENYYHDLLVGKHVQQTFIKNEEERTPLEKKEITNYLENERLEPKEEKAKTIVKKLDRRMSQIDKFKTRYSME